MMDILPHQKKQLEIYISKIRTFHKSATVFFCLAGVIALGTILFHSYPTYRKIQDTKAQVAEQDLRIADQNKKLNKSSADLQKIATDYNSVVQEWKPILDQVLPKDNPTDQVARFLEEFALSSNKKAHPMRIENISFSEPRKENDYFALPFRLSVEADEYNFVGFLNQISRSGSLLREDFYKKTTPVITMSIESISVTLPEVPDIDPALQLESGNGEEAKVPTLVFTVEMLAYFRPDADTGKPKAKI